MATKNQSAKAQINGVENAAMQVVSANANAGNVDAHAEYVTANLSAYSGKQDDLFKVAKQGLYAERKGHNMFGGMWLDMVKGCTDKNYKEFLSQVALKNAARMQRDHIRVAIQLDGQIVDTYYLGCEFKPISDDYVAESEDTLRKCISKSYSKKHKLIILGYQNEGKFVPCSTGEALRFTETREETVWVKKQNDDGTVSVSKKQKPVTDEKGATKMVDVKASVERTMVPSITEHMTPAKFLSAVNRAIKSNWLLIFPNATEETNKESK